MTYSAEFRHAVEEVLNAEGGETNDPADPGGHTKFGISQRAYPDVDIAALTKDAAIDIYHRDYWLAASCDKLPPALAAVVFDAAVNQGVNRTVRMLQASLGVPVDGVLGPVTLRRAALIPKTAVVDFTAQRILHYLSLPTFGRFGKGWVARAIRSAIGASV
jgi:lysozyme family protein